MGVGGHHSLAAFTPGQDPVPIVQEAGWAPGAVWIGAENLAPTGIRSPDLPARRKYCTDYTIPSPGCTGCSSIEVTHSFSSSSATEKGVDEQGMQITRHN
jgi:hypothetical protein